LKPRTHFNNQGYLPNGATGAPGSGPIPSTATALLPNNGRIVQAGAIRVLCVADVRGMLVRWSWSCDADTVPHLGNLRSLNELAKQANAQHVIHTGDFGFYDDGSLERIAEK
jgi:hypothetical protein